MLECWASAVMGADADLAHACEHDDLDWSNQALEDSRAPRSDDALRAALVEFLNRKASEPALMVGIDEVLAILATPAPPSPDAAAMTSSESCRSRGGANRIDYCVTHDADWPVGHEFCDRITFPPEPRRDVLYNILGDAQGELDEPWRYDAQSWTNHVAIVMERLAAALATPASPDVLDAAVVRMRALLFPFDKDSGHSAGYENGWNDGRGAAERAALATPAPPSPDALDVEALARALEAADAYEPNDETPAYWTKIAANLAREYAALRESGS